MAAALIVMKELYLYRNTMIPAEGNHWASHRLSLVSMDVHMCVWTICSRKWAKGWKTRLMGSKT